MPLNQQHRRLWPTMRFTGAIVTSRMYISLAKSIILGQSAGRPEPRKSAKVQWTSKINCMESAVLTEIGTQ